MNRIITDKNEIVVALRYLFEKNGKFRVFYGPSESQSQYCYIYVQRPVLLDFSLRRVCVENEHTRMRAALNIDSILFLEIDTRQNPLSILEIQGILNSENLDCKYLVLEGMLVCVDEYSLQESDSVIAGRSTVPMY